MSTALVKVLDQAGGGRSSDTFCGNAWATCVGVSCFEDHKPRMWHPLCWLVVGKGFASIAAA